MNERNEVRREVPLDVIDEDVAKVATRGGYETTVTNGGEGPVVSLTLGRRESRRSWTGAWRSRISIR